MFCKSLSLSSPFVPFVPLMVHLTASRVNDTTTKVVQPEIIFSTKSETSNAHNERERPNSISVGERGKATMAFSFTDSPQNEYGINSGGLSCLLLQYENDLKWFLVFLCFLFSLQNESSSLSSHNTRHKCHNPGFRNITCISLKYVALLLNIIIIAIQTDRQTNSCVHTM